MKYYFAKVCDFLKSNFFIVAIIAFTWYIWDKPIWGPVPFVGFILSYFLVFERVYNFSEQISKEKRKFIIKTALLFVPGIIGLCLWDWFGWTAWGTVFLFGSFTLIVWKLPLYLDSRWSKSNADHTSSIKIKKNRVFVCFIILLPIIFIIIHPLYIRYEYEHLVSRIYDNSHAVQMSAIYSLGRFAQDHSNYYKRIINILCSTARQISPNEHNSNKRPNENAKRIAHYLGSIQKDELSNSKIIDFRATNLRGANLQNLNYYNAIFSNANLSKVDFFHANMIKVNAERANFDHAKMRFVNAKSANFHLSHGKNVDLRHSNLQKAHFTWGSWKGSDFWNCKLQHAVIRGNTLRNVILKDASMQEVNAVRARFNNTNLINAIMDNGNFSGATFQNAILRSASLRNANLQNANFHNANLRNSILKDANFKGANFKGADLRGVKGLTKEMLTQITINENTRLDNELQKYIDR